MAPLVDIRALDYAYPEGSRALDGVTLALESGLCAVAGPSGGGKSTLLRLLDGLVPHLHGGRIRGVARVDGHDVLRTPARRLARSVGFVFQDAEMQAVHSTVERDVAFALENLGVPRPLMHARVDEVLHRLGLDGLRGRAIASLSGGERQRVAVAGALVLHPRVLALDEPLAQLDAPGAAALLELCRELRDEGTLVVLAEHRLDDVLALADSIVTVARGRVDGPASPALAAAGLDSAPQTVRLSVAMGWELALLSVEAVAARLGGASLDEAPLPERARTDVAWSLDGVVAGPAGATPTLDGVSCAGHAGEVVAVMGRNGAGKTTLLRVLAGLLRPRAGSVERAPGRLAYLPQNPAALLHRATVGDEVEVTLRAAHADGAKRVEAGELMALLGVEALRERDPRDLSSGQRQRAAIAAILAGRPCVALLDEPTRGMDGAARDGLMAAVRRLAEAGTSVVIATHDADLAACVADRVLVIADGGVRDRGDPAHALCGEGNEHATQIGRLGAAPGAVTVAAAVAALHNPRLAVAR